MDQIKGAFGSFGGGGNKNEGEDVQAPPGTTTGHRQPQSQEPGTTSTSEGGGGGGGFLSGLGDKFNSAAGGGRESEKNEDYLDKGLDFVQEKFMGGGKQDNESAVEQAKDEQISDFIRNKYKSSTGTDFPVKDKETRFG